MHRLELANIESAEHPVVAPSARTKLSRLTLALLQAIQVCNQGLDTAVGLSGSSLPLALDPAGLLNCRISFPHSLVAAQCQLDIFHSFACAVVICA